MARMFSKPLWLVQPNGKPTIRTTLAEEQEHRRFATRPGLCVTAETEKEARWIALGHNLSLPGVAVVEHPATRVPVLVMSEPVAA